MKSKLKKGDVCVCLSDNPCHSLVMEGDIVVINEQFMMFDDVHTIEWADIDRHYGIYQAVYDDSLEKIGEL